MAFKFKELLNYAVEQNASDVFLKEKSAPALRVHGRVIPTEYSPLSGEEIQQTVYGLMTPQQISRFEQRSELDLAFNVDDMARFRGNVYRQRGNMAAVFRVIPLAMPSLDDLGMPPALKEIPKQRQGLVLVTGPTGCGKSTTLAAMIDQINQTRECNIVTVEDPIEFIHPDKTAIVSQREVGIDTESFTAALKHVLRQAPDVILVGEMRDVETMSVALQASETGHLVFSTVHTPSCAETMDRIVNMFPPHDKANVAARLANSLRGIVSQKLIRRADGSGRVAAVEVMICTPTISKLIEETRFTQVHQAIAEGGYWGMQTMNQCLVRYFRAGLITEEDALAAAGNLTELRQMLRRPS